jgi:D-3-phosphoglycerate dehydrogenase
LLRTIGEVELRRCRREDLAVAFAEYDVVWFRLSHRIDAELLGERPRCRVLATPVTGLDHIDLEACARRGIEVVSLRGEIEFLKNIRATAELTVALALALLRRLPAAAAAVRAGEWDRDRFRGRELYGKTAGLIGMGRLGSIVAGYFRAFGMDVLGYDPRPDFPHEAATRLESLDELLGRADLVSVHVGYNPTTRHLLGGPQFARLNNGAFLVNTSRGGIVDDQALMAALDSGRLAGAALDVLDGEPEIERDHPLIVYARQHENLLIVPHIGGNTRESFEKTECFLASRVVGAARRIPGFGI